MRYSEIIFLGNSVEYDNFRKNLSGYQYYSIHNLHFVSEISSVLSNRDVKISNLIFVLARSGIDTTQLQLFYDIVITYPEVDFYLYDNSNDKPELGSGVLDIFLPVSKAKSNYKDLYEIDFDNYPSREKFDADSERIKGICIDNELDFWDLEAAYLKYKSAESLVPELIVVNNNTGTIEKNQLFDASNLRAVLREWKSIDMSTNRNYRRIEESRKSNLAISIDSDMQYCMNNGYMLYSSGFRVLPIFTWKSFSHNINFVNKDTVTIVREFDLQFSDEKPEEGEYNEVDYIRGIKVFNNGYTSLLGKKSPSGNIYWQTDSFSDNRVSFISEKYDGLNTRHNLVTFSDGIEVRWLDKPISGLFSPSKHITKLQQIREKNVIKVDDEDYHMILSRIGNKHGKPLDLYDLAAPMLLRAESYYETEHYILSSLLSNEVLLILNGFHKALSIKAYCLLAKSENAVAQSIIGGNESDLAYDCSVRIDSIKRDVRRLVTKGDSNSDYNIEEKNVLNQIFSDCRQFCKEREHFESEDVFISEMAHVNDSFYITEIFRTVSKGITKFIRFIKNRICKK